MMDKFCSDRASYNLQHFLPIFNINWNADLIFQNLEHVIHGLPVSSNNYCGMHLILKKLLSD